MLNVVLFYEAIRMQIKKNIGLKRVAIVDGLRTPFVKQATLFDQIPAIELGAMVVNELIQRNEIDASLIEQCVFGQVIQMPSAPNIAREIVLSTQLSAQTDAYSVSRACATSFQAVANVADAIALGGINIGIAGGADSSSVLPFGLTKNLGRVLLHLSKAKSFTQRIHIMKQLGLRDLLPQPPAITEYSTGLSMGQVAEQMAKTYQLSRQQQDEYAHRSHLLTAKTWLNNTLNKQVMTCYPEPYKTVIQQDNCYREQSILAHYARLKPVFDKRHGSVTAANSSPLTDGAGALLLMSEEKAKALAYPVLGFIRSHAFSANDVQQDMLMGPSYASPLALDKAGVTFTDISLIEMHEAFSAQVLANIQAFNSQTFAQKHLGRNQAIGEIDLDKFNIWGGSLAYGHPFAATGCRLIMQLLQQLKEQGGGLGLATACAAGGLGAAMVLEVET